MLLIHFRSFTGHKKNQHFSRSSLGDEYSEQHWRECNNSSIKYPITRLVLTIFEERYLTTLYSNLQKMAYYRTHIQFYASLNT